MDQENYLNPLDLDHILAQILGYIGTNTKDLLKCRLVNHSWNQISVGILKSKSVVVSLNRCRTQEFNQLLSRATKRPNTRSFPSSTTKLPIMPSAVHLETTEQIFNMITLIGRQLEVNHISLSRSLNRDNIIMNDYSFYQLLDSTASTLSSLDLSEVGPEVELEFSVKNEFEFDFPKLTRIKCKYNGSEDYTEICKQIIASSPNLTAISIPRNFPYSSEKPALFSSLYMNELLKFGTSTCAGLTSLELCIYLESNVISLCRLTFPNLKVLIIHQFLTTLLRPGFGSWLGIGTPNLETIEFHTIKQSKWINHLFNPVSFPQLHHLKQLGFHNYHNNTTDQDQFITSLAVIAKHCPNLEVIRSDAFTIAMLCVALQHNSNFTQVVPSELPEYLHSTYSSLCFPAVSRLTMKANYNVDEKDNLLVFRFNQRNRLTPIDKIFAAVFPNLNEATFEPKKSVSLQQSWFNNSVPVIKLLLGIPGIQRFEFKNYDCDWLAELINGTHNNWLNLWSQSLIQLKLSRFRGRELKNRRTAVVNVGNWNLALALIINRFPRLETIEIDNELLRGDGSTVLYQQVLEELRATRQMHPNVSIKVI